MGANTRAIRMFQAWMNLCEEFGWCKDRAARNKVADLWWQYHDDNGDVYPPGQERPTSCASAAPEVVP